MTNSSTVAMESTVPPKIPVLRIVPPSRWWVLPVAELWAYRELLYFFVWRDIKIRYKQTAIGAAWARAAAASDHAGLHAFLRQAGANPLRGLAVPDLLLLRAAALDVFRGRAAERDEHVVENQRVITKIYFPRLALPLSSVLSGLVDFAISFLDVCRADGLLPHSSHAG